MRSRPVPSGPATGSEHSTTRAARQEPIDKFGDIALEVLAVVEHDEDRPVLEVTQELIQAVTAVVRSPRGLGNGGPQERGVGDRGQIDQPDPIGPIGCRIRPISLASRVLPTPPGPVSVTSLPARRRSRSLATCSSLPMIGVAGVTRLWPSAGQSPNGREVFPRGPARPPGKRDGLFKVPDPVSPDRQQRHVRAADPPVPRSPLRPAPGRRGLRPSPGPPGSQRPPGSCCRRGKAGPQWRPMRTLGSYSPAIAPFQQPLSCRAGDDRRRWIGEGDEDGVAGEGDFLTSVGFPRRTHCVEVALADSAYRSPRACIKRVDPSMSVKQKVTIPWGSEDSWACDRAGRSRRDGGRRENLRRPEPFVSLTDAPCSRF